MKETKLNQENATNASEKQTQEGNVVTNGKQERTSTSKNSTFRFNYFSFIIGGLIVFALMSPFTPMDFRREFQYMIVNFLVFGLFGLIVFDHMYNMCKSAGKMDAQIDRMYTSIIARQEMLDILIQMETNKYAKRNEPEQPKDNA